MTCKDKNYLIIGGSSGIGYAVAEAITQSGGNVIIVSKNMDKLTSAVKKLKNGNNLCYSYDLNDIENIKDIFEFCSSKHIMLDGMIYCAGISPLCLIKENSAELMRKVFNINYFSFVEAVKYFQIEAYSKEKSKIVAISSITSKGAGYRQVLYGSSKAAISSSIKLMAKELLNRGICINAVSPGVVETDMLTELRRESMNLDDKIKQNQPLGIIPAAKVAKIILFLLSDTADYITGTELLYDAGAKLK
ncbi:SDR family NAD(P)-dependent oxidoreductase [Qiania dongpingensis]|uniref:SDR family oxidoreductase n=1 Tax=Qiania dongpingensis TaxID=2763669 RepID=A0A7G9G7S3_9FIRM|nr:SDR family oxidoreductase [Qiania dongpingensis]QNM06855.1 SDR family oxidoreductase [Qiania dongpingensis]